MLTKLAFSVILAPLLLNAVLIKYPCLVGSKSIIDYNLTGILSVEPQPTMKLSLL